MHKKKKYLGGKNTTVSFLQKVHIVFYILLQYPYVSSFPYKQWGGGRGGGWDNRVFNPTQNREQWWGPEQLGASLQLHWAEFNNDAPIQYCTQVIIQIYTDSGVMYKNENGRNLRHYARVFSISRLHLSSKKLADNTKGHLKFFETKRERKNNNFVWWVQSLNICKGQKKSFICSCPHYKC